MEDYCVYLLDDGKGCKIGISKDPAKRVGQLQTGNSSPISLFGYTVTKSKTDALALEHETHEKYRAQHLSGEWYDISSHAVLIEWLRDRDVFVGAHQGTMFSRTDEFSFCFYGTGQPLGDMYYQEVPTWNVGQ